MLENWERILVTPINAEAEITRITLENHGIQAVILNKKDSSYLFGFIEVYVPLEQAFLARQILNNENAN